GGADYPSVRMASWTRMATESETGVSTTETSCIHASPARTCRLACKHRPFTPPAVRGPLVARSETLHKVSHDLSEPIPLLSELRRLDHAGGVQTALAQGQRGKRGHQLSGIVPGDLLRHPGLPQLLGQPAEVDGSLGRH